MDSLALTGPSRRPFMAWNALFTAELAALSRSWVLRGWLIALTLTQFFGLTSVLARGRSIPVPASAVLATTLDGFLLVWSIVIIVLGAGSVSLEADVIADSILSRACTRPQFISAKLASRAFVVLGVYLVAAGVAAYCAWRFAANDLTLTTLITGVGIVGLSVLLLLSIGIALSVVLNNTILAVTGALLLWYVAGPIFSLVGADYLSPSSLVTNLPRMLKDPEAIQLVQASGTQTGITLTFSKPLDPERAENPANYQIESSDGQTYAAQTAACDSSKSSVVLGGLSLPSGATIKVTARNVTDTGGSEISPTANSVEATLPQAGIDKPAGPTAAKPPGRNPVDRTSPRVQKVTATSTSVNVEFTKPMNPKDVEDVKRYTVESPVGRVLLGRTATYSPSTRSALLTGFALSSSDPVKVTVKEVADVDGNTIAPRGNSATYSEITNWKYVLGLGIPTILAFALAVTWFSKRDL